MAPVELVWEVWTHPEHIKNWWGPNGFTNSISLMNVVPKGDWNLVMHGPDGTDYPNKSQFKEVIPFHKLVYEHISTPKFTSTIRFESRSDTTFLEWQLLFETREQMMQVVKAFRADEGLTQNVDKLQSYLHAQFRLRKESHRLIGGRTSTYLNFPGNTEKAFLYYRSVFQTEFAGNGIQRFGDIPPLAGHPPVTEADK